MKKEVMRVPQDKCPLDLLAEMGEQTKSAWIFLHRNTVEKLISTADSHVLHCVNGFQELFWQGTDALPETTLWVEWHDNKVWLEVYLIQANDIAFNHPVADPDEIIFINMEE